MHGVKVSCTIVVHVTICILHLTLHVQVRAKTCMRGVQACYRVYAAVHDYVRACMKASTVSVSFVHTWHAVTVNTRSKCQKHELGEAP
jgi:hypothetical protein